MIKSKLIGKRLVLKRKKASVIMATTVFNTVSDNRKHLRPWFPWVDLTLRVEDSLKYLFENEDKFKSGEKVEYSIWLKQEYIGNIGIFNISKEKKSAEIGYWLSSKFTRNGYMTEAVRIIEKEFFINQDLNRIQIRCDEANLASAGVAKKCKYFLEGKCREESYSKYFKSFRSNLVFSKLKSEFKKEKLK